MQGRQVFSAFFSYAHLDAQATPRHVEPLAKELENIVTARLVNAGLAVWRDVTHLHTGRRWNPEIEARLGASDILIVLFSASWIGSDYCRREYVAFEAVERGYGDGELVVPILLRPIDGQEEHLDDEQRAVYERLRERQFFPRLAVGVGNRQRAIEEVAGHIVEILNRRRNAPIAARVSADENVPLPMLREILENFGEAGAALDAAAIEARLRAKAGEYAELRDRLNRLSNADPRVRELRREAARLIAAGDFIAADAALSQAEKRDLDAAEEMEATARQRRLGAAESRAERAAAARLQLDYRAAAAHYAEAAAILLPGETRQRWVYAVSQAHALYDQGDEFGDNAALREAIEVYRGSLPLVPRGDAPRDWATTQNNLGNALWALGGRESGTARLEEAVAAFRAALEELTRERVPLDWAATQNNLGTALGALGERESGTARLEEAVAAFRAVLEEYTRERVPLDWATTQNNLGTALQVLGERESGTARLEEAVAAYRAALEERTRERVPLNWAMTQNNLGNALSALGDRESGTARLEEAVAAYRAALEERTRERVPLGWASTQNNLGTALRALGDRESGTARLEEAVAACRAALEERTRERVPLDWAYSQHTLANGLATLAEHRKSHEQMDEALVCMRKAVDAYEQVGENYWLPRARRRVDDIQAALAALRKSKPGTARKKAAKGG